MADTLQLNCISRFLFTLSTSSFDIFYIIAAIMSGESAMRNAVKRITHKERAQPSSRKRLGLLEKHKDYVERAADFKKKRASIVNLKRKAADRNPDEFYFQMNSSEVKKGVHRNIENRTLDSETVRMLKTQDMGYIALKKSTDDSKIEKLKGSLHLIGQQQKNKHIIFADTVEEVKSFKPAEYFETTDEFADRAFNRSRPEQLQKTVELNSGLKPKDIETISKLKMRSYKELRARSNRSLKLKKAYMDLSLQRHLSHGRGTKKKLVIKEDGSVLHCNSEVAKEMEERDRVVFKWKRERAS